MNIVGFSRKITIKLAPSSARAMSCLQRCLIEEKWYDSFNMGTNQMMRVWVGTQNRCQRSDRHQWCYGLSLLASLCNGDTMDEQRFHLWSMTGWLRPGQFLVGKLGTKNFS
ncbi:uncharacterized protein [Bemisia tabaci]|uniref:uncharacterized protein n=1 Tax=Bemisia tabaci TaxID=7038 RepID=UPI003B287FD5